MYIRLCTSFLCASCIETLSKQDENGSMLNARSVFVCCYVLIVATLSLMLLLIPLFCLAFNQFHAQNNSMPIHIILLSIHVYFYFFSFRFVDHFSRNFSILGFPMADSFADLASFKKYYAHLLNVLNCHNRVQKLLLLRIKTFHRQNIIKLFYFHFISKR